MCLHWSTKDFAEDRDAAADASTYVGLDEVSMESFPMKARTPADCMASARIKLKWAHEMNIAFLYADRVLTLFPP